MESFFKAEFFEHNRSALRSLFKGTAPIVITANGLLQRSGDTTFPFRQDSNFWYLTGIDEPDVILVMDKDKEYLIVPERKEKRTVFDGVVSPEAMTEISGIKDVLDEKTGRKQLADRLRRVKHIATLAAAPTYLLKNGFYTNPARHRLIKDIKTINSNAKLLDLREHLTRMRVVKQEPELDAIRAAIDVTVKALKQTAKRINKYTYEYEIEADITKSFRRQGGANHAYQPIVAGGLNACTLHYVANNAKLDKNQLVLIDVGAEVSHYTADVTRTYSVSKPSSRQTRVFEAVKAVREFALNLLKPGVLLKEYDHEVHNFLGEQLRQLGLIKTIKDDSVRRYFPHSVSHFLGLDVHDVGDYKMPLQLGMVLTVEPGIYIPEENIGIRLEDDVLITSSGIEILSHKLPSEL